MSSSPSLVVAPRAREARRALLLAGIGAWAAIVPYLGKALGLVVNVPDRVEVVDHVVPGAVIVAAALYLHRLARRRPVAGHGPGLLAAGASFLAGFWILATHVPLLGDAARDAVSWEAAIWHSIAALPIVVLACWFVLRAIPDD